jgi:hypothetical protein
MLIGAQVCPDCYLSETNNQSVVATPGVSYSFQSVGMVICNLAGAIFETSGTSLIGYAWGNYIFNGMDGSQCYYMLYCPNGNTTATCGKQVPGVYVPGPPANTCLNYSNDLRLTVNGQCFPMGKAALSSKAINCS